MKHAIEPSPKFTITSGTEKWYRVGAPSGQICAVMVRWHDGTTAFDAPVFYTSNLDDPTVPADGASAPDLEQWALESSVTGTAVTAGAAGSQMYHLGNNGAKWVMVKVNPTANSIISFAAHAKS